MGHCGAKMNHVIDHVIVWVFFCPYLLGHLKTGIRKYTMIPRD
jgi:hypothetical protein